MSAKKKSTADDTEADKLKDIWVVILCGLPGSGKSTLRKKLVEQGWHYVSQDELGSIEECGKLLVKALKTGHSCIVDRCNVTSSERRLCMQLANRAVEKGDVKGVKLHFEAVWMATPPDVCKMRAATREIHETLSADNASDVIDQFCKGLKIPQRSGQEPYDAVLSIANSDDELLVLQRYGNPANIDTTVMTLPPSAAHIVPASPDELNGDDSLPAELFVVRHGERADRAKGRDEGWPDDPVLTREGQDTAKRAGIALRSLRPTFAAVYSSPFCRCLQTADQIAAELGLPIRVEPGLSELGSVFEEAPQLRTSSESLARALQRSEIDCSVPPIEPACPWPEEVRDANRRVIAVTKALADRHKGQTICLISHAHSVIEITRHVPETGGGSASSTCGYCAMSHISQSGVLQQCLDLSYLKGSSSQQSTGCDILSAPGSAMGYWADDWHWIDPDTLLAMSLDEVLEKYTTFKEAFQRGSEEQKQSWQQGWASPDEDMRRKLWRACEKGMF